MRPDKDQTSMSEAASNFIEEIIEDDLKRGKNSGRIATRFPPEPNGYLHIGHAKAISLNFGIAAKHSGTCNLRFDDTNPEKEEEEYVEAIKRDLKWLGFDWGDRTYFASDYYEKFYGYALDLINKGKAYVCSLSPDQIREYRGTLTRPGKESPYRDRSVEESLDLFRRMRKGEFKEGEHLLRAKIDMASPNINMRDPAIYRIKHESHHRTKDKWCIYPMYDFAHCLSDSLEGITHSICTLEFENHRPLYDWFLNELELECHPQQIEFARLNLTKTLMSKRKLQELVDGGCVSGWDDPRMPTLAGMRRRGYTPEAIRNFCERIGVAKTESVIDMALLEHFIRDDLNRRAPRVMAVLDPLRVVIDNYPEGKAEELEAVNNPEDEGAGTRAIPFSREIYIERDDFREDPPKKFFRLAPGREVRLKHAYYIKCVKAVKDPKTGEIIELHCSYDPDSRGGSTADRRKVAGTIHWVSAAGAIDAEVRLYNYLLSSDDAANAPAGDSAKGCLSPDSFKILNGCKVEPGLKDAGPGSLYQFLRLGYFCVDPDSASGKPVFNRTATLKDAWAKIKKSL
ncbi:MAG: glutamine--tRNA ligase/YqeY domain fusion protein [Candidatus Omnitrophota bacterium]